MKVPKYFHFKVFVKAIFFAILLIWFVLFFSMLKHHLFFYKWFNHYFLFLTYKICVILDTVSYDVSLFNWLPMMDIHFFYFKIKRRYVDKSIFLYIWRHVSCTKILLHTFFQDIFSFNKNFYQQTFNAILNFTGKSILLLKAKKS